jgi:uncharacterized protein YjdB
VKATGKFSDGASRDLTSSVSWAVEGTDIASVSNAGVIHPIATGQGFIRADYETVSIKASLTVAAAPLVSLEILPSSPTLPLGLSVQLKAVGHYADSSTTDLTGKVGWSSSSTTVASVGSDGQAVSRSVGTTTVSASVGNVQASAKLSITAAALTAVAVTTNTTSLPLGQKAQMHAIGSFTDASQRDLTTSAQWASSNPKVVAVDNSGLATASLQGSATISATMQSLSGSSALSVTSAALTAVTVTTNTTSLPLGQKAQMHAIGSFTDSSQQDLSSSAQWASSNPKVVAVDNLGLATASLQGSATISATVQSLSGSSALSVTSATLTAVAVTTNTTSLPLGQKAQMHAIGSFTDSSQQDLSSSALWTSSNPKVVAVNNSGLATAGTLGSVTISATVQSLSGSSSLSVTSAALTAIAVTADTSSLPLGQKTQMHAIGSFTDGSQQDLNSSALWTSSNPKVVAVNNSGLATAGSLGSANVSAAVQSLSASSALSVTSAALVSLSVSPSSSVILLGRTQQLLVTGMYSDGSTADLTANATWDSSDPQTATVDSHGGVFAFDVGNAQVTASYQNQQASSNVTVQPTLAVSRFVLPPIGMDATLRILSPGSKYSNVCAMIYVFDQNQQMSECCGCNVSPDGLLTLSYSDDLLANPLTGMQPSAGTAVVISADQATNPDCDAGNITPSGRLATWSTTLEDLGHQSHAVTENHGSDAALADTDLANIQAQCAFVKILGSGHGLCSCGKSPAGSH